MQQLEHPFYSLSKKPVTSVREYHHGDHWLRITPSVTGLATIYDKDILIYAISQLMNAQNAGQEINPSIRINAHDFLPFTNRGTAGKDYQALIEALERLRGTTISTNIRTSEREQVHVFGLIDSGSVRRTFGLDDRLVSIDIVLSDRLINVIKVDEVPTEKRTSPGFQAGVRWLSTYSRTTESGAPPHDAAKYDGDHRTPRCKRPARSGRSLRSRRLDTPFSVRYQRGPGSSQEHDRRA